VSELARRDPAGASLAAMSPTPRRIAALALAAGLTLAGCSTIEQGPPSPTPLAFPGIAGELGRVGITVSDWRSGDAGCDDTTLTPTAVAFKATGAGMTTPTLLRVYIFGDKAAWTRRSADVDTCVAAWATDPATVELIDVSPYVLAGQGPWPAAFKTALRDAITRAAGTGG